MNRSKTIKSLTLGSLFSIISALFQTAPIYFPVIGLLLSPLSTLPIAISGIYSFYLALYVYMASAFLILFISFEEALIFIFTTGLIGLAISIFINKKKPILSILTSTVFLSTGIILLTYIFQIVGFKELSNNFRLEVFLLIVTLFSLIYSSIWMFILRRIKKYLYFILKIP